MTTCPFKVKQFLFYCFVSNILLFKKEPSISFTKLTGISSSVFGYKMFCTSVDTE
jgi:hypothetical protein